MLRTSRPERGSRMRIQSGQLVALGYGKYARSDEVVAIEPISEGRGPGRRTLVWVRGVVDPLVASRSEGAIVDDLVTPAEEATRMRQQRATLRQMTTALEKVSPALRRVIEEDAGTSVDDLLAEAQKVLG
jgi:hypothetical protein